MVINLEQQATHHLVLTWQGLGHHIKGNKQVPTEVQWLPARAVLSEWVHWYWDQKDHDSWGFWWDLSGRYHLWTVILQEKSVPLREARGVHKEVLERIDNRPQSSLWKHQGRCGEDKGLGESVRQHFIREQVLDPDFGEEEHKRDWESHDLAHTNRWARANSQPFAIAITERTDHRDWDGDLPEASSQLKSPSLPTLPWLSRQVTRPDSLHKRPPKDPQKPPLGKETNNLVIF